MELGEKLRSARLEAGLTQKQLCEDIVTRNMLSQIENGNAKPSMGTLAALARRLGKSIGYFLEETAVVSANTQVMEEVRMLFDSGEFAKAMAALEQYREPDRVYDREKQLLETICCLNLAQQAIAEQRESYARQWLEKAKQEPAYCAEDLNRRRLLIRGQLRGERVSGDLPSLDAELMIRATEAKDPLRAAALLDACEDQKSARWNLLRGRLWMAKGNFTRAESCLLLAERQYPRESAPMLESCFREQGDFKRAYEYACKQKKRL